MTATPDKLDLYEEIGFRRSKNSFTYVGKALSDDTGKRTDRKWIIPANRVSV